MTNCVILVRDRYALTEQCLSSLYKNTPADQFNLVVVNDGSEEIRVKRLLAAYADINDNCSVLTVANSGHTLSQLKNLGIAWSEQRFGRGDWLHVGDSDVCFMPGWISRLTAAAETSEMDIRFRLWGGQIHPFHQSIKQISIDMTESEVLDGPSWFMRWDTWDKYGPLDRTTAPGVCQSEEYGFCERLRRANVDSHNRGGRIGVIHPHVVIHTGLTHLDGSDCVGRKEREALIPPGVLAL